MVETYVVKRQMEMHLFEHRRELVALVTWTAPKTVETFVEQPEFVAAPHPILS